MKIIVATPLYPPEIERLSVYTRDLAKYLSVDNQLTILAYANQTEEDSNINIVKVNKNQPLLWRLFYYTWALLKLAKQADIIYAQNAVASGLPAIIVKYLSGKPVLINFLEDEAYKRAINLNLTNKSWEEFILKPSMKGHEKIGRIIKIQTWVLRRASKVLVASQAMAQVITQVYKVSEKNIVVNYNPEDRQQKLDFDMTMIPQQIFASGPLTAWTGMEDIIKTVSKLKAKYKNIKLIISGNGVDRHKLLELVKNLDLVDQVVILGQISKAQEWYLLKTSNVYVHNFFGIDLASNISHSFLARTAVIAKNTEYNRELLVEEGLYNNTDELVSKISAIFEDDELRKKLIDKASHDLELKFSWSAHLARLNDILEIFRQK
ncbi:MAG: glycosyltransferase [Patescibacteria group bacterium]|jgi:glycosyltransferase involved in cell wall biosynthesis